MLQFFYKSLDAILFRYFYQVWSLQSGHTDVIDEEAMRSNQLILFNCVVIFMVIFKLLLI